MLKNTNKTQTLESHTLFPEQIEDLGTTIATLLTCLQIKTLKPGEISGPIPESPGLDRCSN
jgi:hypothetical protein